MSLSKGLIALSTGGFLEHPALYEFLLQEREDSNLNVSFFLTVGVPTEERSAAIAAAGVLATLTSGADERVMQPGQQL